MSADPSTPADERFTKLLIACDEALAAGKPAGVVTDASAPEDLRARLERGVDCLHLLEQYWSGRRSPMEADAESPHVTQLGRFQIRRELGHGSFGRVFLAHDPLLGREVALKIPRVPALLTPELRQRFHREAMAAARLDHPNLVPVYDAGVIDDICFITSPYCPGTTLAAWLQQQGKPVPWRIAARLVEILAESVQHAHNRGIIHRDLKPANVLLQEPEEPGVRGQGSEVRSQESGVRSQESGVRSQESGVRGQGAGAVSSPFSSGTWQNGLTPRITDFGLAKLLEEGQADQTGTGLIVGSPCYMAPEQAEAKNRGITTAVDVYALGAILYEMVTARPPFVADTVLATLDKIRTQEPLPPRQAHAQVPRDLETICLKCLQKDPRKRYATAHELAADLRRSLHSEPIQARPVGSLERLVRWGRRNPALAALIAVVCAGIALITAGSLLASVGMKRERDRALEAEQRTRVQLWQSLVAQARAARSNNSPGRRFDSLDRLAEAFDIVRSLGEERERRLEFRNEFIASLALPDLRVVERWPTSFSEPHAAALDASFEHYAFSDEKGAVHIRRVSGNQEISCLPGLGKPCSSFQFIANSHLAVVQYAKPVPPHWNTCVWNLEKQQIFFWVPFWVPLWALDTTPDGRWLAVATDDGIVRLIDVQRREPVKILARGAVPYRLAFDPSGRKLAAAARPDSIEIRDVATGKITASWPQSKHVRAVAWDPQGKLLAGCCGRQVTIWEAESGRQLALCPEHEGDAVDVAFNHEGDRLISGSWDGTVRLCDVSSGRQLASHPGVHGFCLRFGPDDRLLGLATDGASLGLWETALGRECRLLVDPDTNSRGVAFSPDGRLLASSGEKGVSLWDWASGRRLQTVAAGLNYTIFFTPLPSDHGDLMVVGERGVQTLSVKSGPGGPSLSNPRPLWTDQELNRAALSLDGQVLFASTYSSRSSSGEGLVWQLDKLQKPAELRGHPGITFVAISPDKRWLASGTWGGTGVRIWDTHTGAISQKLPIDLSAMVAFSPDGKTLVTSTAKEYCLWQVGSWKPRLVIPSAGQQGVPGYLAFSPDGKTLAITHSRTRVRLVDPITGLEQATLRAPEEHEVQWICFGPDGTQLAVAYTNGLIHAWDLRLIRAQLAARGLDWE